MKWYDYIIQWDKCRRWVWPVFFVVFAWGVIHNILGISLRVPGSLLLIILVLWIALWIVATVLYRKNLKK